MKNLRKITIAALLLLSATAAFAGPGPQYWARIGENNPKTKEVKATVPKSKADKKIKTTSQLTAQVDTPKGK